MTSFLPLSRPVRVDARDLKPGDVIWPIEREALPPPGDGCHVIAVEPIRGGVRVEVEGDPVLYEFSVTSYTTVDPYREEWACPVWARVAVEAPMVAIGQPAGPGSPRGDQVLVAKIEPGTLIVLPSRFAMDDCDGSVLAEAIARVAGHHDFLVLTL